MSTGLTNIKTLVVKIGTTLLSGEKPFDGQLLKGIVSDLAKLKNERKMNILIVSSGAVGCGMNALDMQQRPKSLPVKQATAAVGQAILMQHYDTLFHKHGDGIRPAQVLLTAADLDHRQTYLNVRNTIQALFEMRTVIPVVNENDSTAVDELTGSGKFGDNDTLAAKMAAKIDADLLIILSDIDGLYDKNPSTHSDAKLIEHVDAITAEVEALAGGTNVQTSVGGMKTKLVAARIACAAGVPVVIANGRRANIIPDVLNGTAPCTLFKASGGSLCHRKRWIAFGRRCAGTLFVDDGAKTALIRGGKSLLPAGVTRVEGAFGAGAAVKITGPRGIEIARGLVNYSSDDIERIKGLKSRQIREVLGHQEFDEVIHRNNLVVL